MVISSGSTVVEVALRIGISEKNLPLTGRVWQSPHRLGAAPEPVGDGEHPTEDGRGRTDQGQPDTQGDHGGKLLSPARRRQCVEHVGSVLQVSVRRACKVLEQPRYYLSNALEDTPLETLAYVGGSRWRI